MSERNKPILKSVRQMTTQLLGVEVTYHTLEDGSTVIEKDSFLRLMEALFEGEEVMDVEVAAEIIRGFVTGEMKWEHEQ